MTAPASSTATKLRTTIRPKGEPSSYIYDAIPDELRSYHQWVVWRLTSNGKKLPFNARIDPKSRINEVADSTDPTTWANYEEAVYTLTVGLQQRSKAGYLYRVYPDGIGFVFTKDDPFVGLDFDKCITDDAIPLGIRSLTEQTYSEISQSGTGVKAIGRGTLIAALKDDDIEIYSEGRFFALTGRVVSNNTITNVQPTIDTLVKARRPNGQHTRPRNIDSIGTDSALNWSFIHWLEHNPSRLWRDDGMPHIAYLNCPASQQLLAILTDGTLPPALAAKAQGDHDSEYRSALGFTTQKLGMLPEERYVILRTLTARYTWNKQKNERQLDADYHRLIFDKYPVAAERTASVSRSRYATFVQEPQPIEVKQPQVLPTERKPAHRPAGDKARQIKRTHRMLVSLANEDGIVSDITTAELADEYKKHYPTLRTISTSSMRDYLRAGRDAELWVAEQENGNGRLVITIKQLLFCHPKSAETICVGATDTTDVLPILTQQTPQNESQCIKEEGKDTALLTGGSALQPGGINDDTAFRRASLRLPRSSVHTTASGTNDGHTSSGSSEARKATPAEGRGIQNSGRLDDTSTSYRGRPECTSPAAESVKRQAETIGDTHTTTVFSPLEKCLSPVPTVMPSALAAATAWLATLQPWQIDKMRSFTTRDALLAWLEYRTLESLDAVVIALQSVAVEPAPHVAPVECVPASPAVAAEPTEGGGSVTSKADAPRSILTMAERVASRRRRHVDTWTHQDYSDLSAIMEGQGQWQISTA